MRNIAFFVSSFHPFTDEEHISIFFIRNQNDGHPSEGINAEKKKRTFSKLLRKKTKWSPHGINEC